MQAEERPEIVRILAKHGGIRAVHTCHSWSMSHDDRTTRIHRGSHNVIECMDGSLIQMDKAESDALADHHDYLRLIRAQWGKD